MEQIIEKLKQQARDSWKGEEGEKRAVNLEKYLRDKTKEYSDALGVTQEEMLRAWEERRDYSAINYYQEANQPSLSNSNTRVFENVEEVLESIGKKGFRCPSCGGISTNPYECDSGDEMIKGKICDWKVYGLFKDLGKGAFVFIKDKLRGDTIFMPIAWEEDRNQTKSIQWKGDNLKEVIKLIGLHHSITDKNMDWEDYEELVKKEGLKVFTSKGPVFPDIGDFIVKYSDDNLSVVNRDPFEDNFK